MVVEVSVITMAFESKFEMPNRDIVLVTHNTTEAQTFMLKYWQSSTGRLFVGNFDSKYLAALPLLALHPGVLGDIRVRRPDTVETNLNDVISIGWQVTVGTGRASLAFPLKSLVPDMCNLLKRIEQLERRVVHSKRIIRNQREDSLLLCAIALLGAVILEKNISAPRLVELCRLVVVEIYIKLQHAVQAIKACL